MIQSPVSGRQPPRRQSTSISNEVLMKVTIILSCSTFPRRLPRQLSLQSAHEHSRRGPGVQMTSCSLDVGILHLKAQQFSACQLHWSTVFKANLFSAHWQMAMLRFNALLDVDELYVCDIYGVHVLYWSYIAWEVLIWVNFPAIPIVHCHRSRSVWRVMSLECETIEFDSAPGQKTVRRAAEERVGQQQPSTGSTGSYTGSYTGSPSTSPPTEQRHGQGVCLCKINWMPDNFKISALTNMFVNRS